MSDYRVDLDTGCWVWRRAKTKAGYGQMYVDGKMAYGERQCRECNRIRGRGRTQRWAADFKEKRAAQSGRNPAKDLILPFVPPIPLGTCQCGYFRIDHTCRNRLCVDPDHLEAVTAIENVHRARAEGP